MNHEAKSLKSKLLEQALKVFVVLFRTLPYSPLKLWSKHAIFDRYFAWRKLSTVTTTNFGASVHVKLPDIIQQTIMLTGRWEYCITDLIARRLKSGDIFIDVGANIGYYSLLGSQRVGDDGKVYSIEANPKIFEMLLNNVALNRRSNINTINKAVSSHDGVCDIYSGPESNIGHSSIMADVARSENMQLEAVVKCQMLKEIIPLPELLRARFIKIDIEGSERLAIEGMVELLPRFSEETEWLIELSPSFSANGLEDTEWIFDKMAAAGYSAYIVRNEYNEKFYYRDEEVGSLVRIHEAPREPLSDVLFSRFEEAYMVTRTDK
jgi:FkbM family methyltransferase